MKVPVIKKLVEQYSLEQLRAAEEALLNEEKPAIDLGADDPGDQLTHVIGAIQVHETVARGQADLKTALRLFIDRVRNSIN